MSNAVFLTKCCLVQYLYSCPSTSALNKSREKYVIVKTDVNFNTTNYSTLLNQLRQVKSSRSMKDFLENYISWYVKIYAATDFDSLLRYISNNSQPIVFSELCDTCSNSDEKNMFFETVEKFYGLLWVLGLLSLLGNVMTIIYELKMFMKQNRTSAKESKVYNLLVLNLCLAHLLTALYFVVFATAFKLNPIASNVCNALGIMSALSSQVSASILVTITTYRLCGILFPFNRIQLKFAIVFLLLTWVLWLLIVSLPLFNESIFAHEFTQVVEVDSSNETKYVELHKIIRTVQKLAQDMNVTNEPFSQVLHALKKYQSNEVAIQLIKSFNLMTFQQTQLDEIKYLNYYDPKMGCTLDPFVEAKNASAYFTALLFLFNLFEYCFIIIAYLIMFKHLSNLHFRKFLLGLKQSRAAQRQNLKVISKRKVENKYVYNRIFAVVVTNIICGIPICIIAIVYNFGSILFDCLPNRFFKHWALPVFVILYSFNSIINPYIYSFPFWKSLILRGKQRLLRCLSQNVIK